MDPGHFITKPVSCSGTDIKGFGRLERQEKTGKNDAEDGNVSEKPGHTQGLNPSTEEDGERAGRPAPEHGNPEQCPPVPAASTCCQRQGGRWGNGGRRAWRLPEVLRAPWGVPAQGQRGAPGAEGCRQSGIREQAGCRQKGPLLSGQAHQLQVTLAVPARAASPPSLTLPQ